MKVFLIVGNLLVPIAVLIFATGFFPYKPFLPGLAKYHELPEHGPPPRPQFDKLVFMVVDALRSDFVFSSNSGFSFTQKSHLSGQLVAVEPVQYADIDVRLIRRGEALPFTANAPPPTITMPRVKAITTGSIPSFLDVILNFAESDTTSTLANQDTWLAQIKAAKNGTLIMYGDDTWLKLFPNTFARADGTTSFFVSDFTEVDNNVTRHVADEMRARDWDVMVMHYLGLDHIGHKAGPQSPNMIPKQIEMDGIVRQIYEAINTQQQFNSTLLVLCGDHGMNEAGNHGGSAAGETSPALVFISPKLKMLSPGRESPAIAQDEYDYYTTVQQSDVVPTIAGLLGVPIPLNNLGVFIPDFLPLWSQPRDQLQLYLRNALQMLDIVKVTFPTRDFDDWKSFEGCESPKNEADEVFCKWKEASRIVKEDQVGEGNIAEKLESLQEFCKKAQLLVGSAATNYDVNRLIIGILLATSSLAPLLFISYGTGLLRSMDGMFIVLVGLLHGAMMFASSYVEEEQHFWYWITAGWFAYLFIRSSQNSTLQPFGLISKSQFSMLTVAVLHRIIQRWNQTGQKHAGEPDIVHDIMIVYPVVLWIWVAFVYIITSFKVAYSLAIHLESGKLLGSSCSVMPMVLAFTFKLGFTATDSPELLNWLSVKTVETLRGLPLVMSARLVFGTLGLDVVWALAALLTAERHKISQTKFLETIHSLLTVFLVTQTRAHNIPIYLLFFAQQRQLRLVHLSTLQISVTTILLAHVSFFALGNSNAISSIDLSNGYNGISGYNVAGVGILVFASNWAGPIWWSVTGILLMANSTSDGKELPKNPISTPREVEASPKVHRDWVAVEHSHLGPKKMQNGTSIPTTSKSSPYLEYFTLSTLFMSCSVLALMLACTLLRTHLFIWTVFSPKYLYAMAWSLGYHLLISLALTGGLWGAVRKLDP